MKQAAKKFIIIALLFLGVIPMGAQKKDTISAIDISCKSELIQNGVFLKRMPDGSAVSWSKVYGNPLFNFTAGQGCVEDGYVEIKGNQIKGDAIAQVLSINNQIRTGKKYKLTIAVRFMANLNSNDYGKIRVIAFNGALPASGLHPAPDANIAIIGRSGKIRDCGDWAFLEFPVWRANKNYQNIAINAFSDNQTMSTVWIDDVTLCETDKELDCTEVLLDQNNKPIVPQGYGVTPAGFNCAPEAEEENNYNGSLQDLYGSLYGYNGTDNWYSQAKDKCFSIGGTLPPEVINYNCDDSLKALGINMTCDEFQKQLNNPNLDFLNNIPKPNPLPPLKSLSSGGCSDLPTINNNMAFNGKDIIFIHGLMLDHLCDRADGTKGATLNWPDHPEEFYKGGYYHSVAENNWEGNIGHYIEGTTGISGYHNRYLIVTYNCAQSAEVAVHCVLTQIREAMENGKGVVYDDTDQRKTNCFGRDYIFISHSTGAIISDVALSIANKTKTDNALKAKYGDIGLISDRCRGRLSVRGALSGSSLATIMVNFQSSQVLSFIASEALTRGKCQKQFNSNVDRSMVLNSILVDLIPKVTRTKWSSYINTVPVPVLTIASGHPSAIISGLKFIIHPGFDDGVVTMDCASGRNNSLLNQPTTYNATSTLKAFDMGQNGFRAACYFLDQHNAQKNFAVASIPYLSPTGMVQPIASVTASTNFNNHFTFLQSASEHWLRKKAEYIFTTDYNYSSTLPIKSDNNEEELAITDLTLFSKNLVSPAIIAEMGEFEKGRFIEYPMIKIIFRHGLPRPTVYWNKFYIWKRTYHKMKNEKLFDFDYAYKYLFKN